LPSSVFKCFHLQGASPPDPLTISSAPGPRWGLRTTTARFRTMHQRYWSCHWEATLAGYNFTSDRCQSQGVCCRPRHLLMVTVTTNRDVCHYTWTALVAAVLAMSYAASRR